VGFELKLCAAEAHPLACNVHTPSALIIGNGGLGGGEDGLREGGSGGGRDGGGGVSGGAGGGWGASSASYLGPQRQAVGSPFW
jgi:hypothetical protein